MTHYEGNCGRCSFPLKNKTGICENCGWSFEQDAKDNPHNYTTTGGKPLVDQIPKDHIITWELPGGGWLTSGKMRGEMRGVVRLSKDEAGKLTSELNAKYPHITHRAVARGEWSCGELHHD